MAKAAGVSPATVSFVLNDTPGQTISASTRERVRSAAAELGYAPHGIARALREGSSRIVLLVLDPSLRGAGTDGFLRGLDAELSAHDHVLLAHRGSSSSESVEVAVQRVAPRAVIDVAELQRADADDADVPGAPGLAAHSAVQVRHLAAAGHEAIAFALPEDPSLGALAVARLSYARAAAASAGLPAPVPFTLPADPARADAAVADLLTRDPALTAFAAFDDRVALGILPGVRALGLVVPDDVAVIGFDDAGLGLLSRPPLTSVRIDAEAFGRRAARRALGLEADVDAVPVAEVVGRGTV